MISDKCFAVQPAGVLAKAAISPGGEDLGSFTAYNSSVVAALSDAAFPRVVDLRQLRADDLEPLLAEEIDEWEQKLDWDFRGSSELVERFVSMRALTGYALVAANRVVGYTYYVCEERKGLIGDLYVMEMYRTEAAEDQLLSPVIDTLIQAPWVRRIESQLMMLSRSFDRNLPMSEHASLYPRTFMEISLDGIETLPLLGRNHGITYQTWAIASRTMPRG